MAEIQKFQYTPAEIFQNSTSYPDVTNADDMREQLSRPHKQQRDFINNTLLPAIDAVNATKATYDEEVANNKNAAAEINTLKDEIFNERQNYSKWFDEQKTNVSSQLEKQQSDYDTWTADAKQNATDQRKTEDDSFNEWFDGVKQELSGFDAGSAAIDLLSVKEDVASVKEDVASVKEDVKKPKYTAKSVTLSASGWADGVYTITDELVTANSLQELGPAEGITSEQSEALGSANLVPAGQSAGSFKIKANGDVPTIDIPVEVVYWG